MCCQGKQLQHGNTSGSSFQKYNTAAYWNLYPDDQPEPTRIFKGMVEVNGMEETFTQHIYRGITSNPLEIHQHSPFIT